VRALSFSGLLLALVTGCVGPPVQTTLSRPTTTTLAVTTTTIDPAQVVTQFGACLEEQGISVPSLPLDPGGRPNLSGLAIANDPASPEFREALVECAPILAASGLLLLDDQPAVLAAVRRYLAGFSDCMRRAGVEEFPDPLPDFDGSSPPFLAELIPREDPDLPEAIGLCSAELGVAPITR
jgi:hypothetical protein